MELNELLATYNLIELPENSRVIQTEPVESLDDKLKKYEQFKASQKENTEPVKELSKSLGFEGFFYHPKEKKSKESIAILAATPIAGNNSITKAYNFFADKGFSKVQVAGILGNLLGESGLNPKAVNQAEKNANLSGYGRGIAQWSNERVNNFRLLIGKSPENASLDEQLAFAWHEMLGRPALLSALKRSQNVKEATDAVYRGFENGSANALASVDLLTRTYGRAWARLGYRPYNFNNELATRVKSSNKALAYIS